MFTHKNLMTVCCAAVFAFGLAACGSSGSDDKMAGTPPMKVPPVTSGVASLDAAAVAGAIGPDDDREPPMQPFTAERGEVTSEADGAAFEMTMATLPDLGEGWAGAEYMRTDQEADAEADLPVEFMIATTVVSYTNADAPGDQAYSEYYGSADRHGVDGSANDGVLTLLMEQTGNHELFMADFGITAGYQTVPITSDGPDTTESTFKGMFNSIPGTFTCDGTCSVSSDSDGNLITLTGDWTFMPDEGEHMIAGVVLDTDYLDFGFWVKTTTAKDGTTISYEVGTFAGGTPESGAVTDVVGTAKYAGPSTGVYMMKSFDPNSGVPIPGAAGQFTAHANLTANFGGEEIEPGDRFTVSGTVSDFMNSAGEMIDEKWEVELMKSESGSQEPGDFTGATTGEGSYSGTFHGDVSGGKHPGAVTATYDAHFSNGHAAGAFGATLVTEDE